jgi:uncharacterized membrane protein YfcA
MLSLIGGAAKSSNEGVSHAMPLSTMLIVLLLGLLVGVVGGMVGIGGGVLAIPVLMIGFGFSQAKANGTSLAMLLPPIGIFAVLSYSRAGNIDWKFAGLLALGFAVGAYVGARLVNTGKINPTMLRLLFAMLLLYVAGRILFRSGGYARPAFATSLLILGFTLTWAWMRFLGKRWHRAAPSWSMIYRQKHAQSFEHDYEI